MEFNLTRMTFDDIQSLLTLVENKVPGCTIDPVINSVIKSKKLARKAAMDESDRIEIVYNSRRAIKEIIHTFTTTADSWIRMGPILTFVIFAPVWLSATKGAYSMPISDTSATYVGLHDAIVKAMAEMDSSISSGIGNVGSVFWGLVSNPFLSVIMAAILVPVIYHFIRIALKPNRLVLTPEKIYFSTMSDAIKVQQTAWSEIETARLVKPSVNAGPERWVIELKRTGMAPFKMDLAALSPEDRMRLSRGFDRWAPHCAIEHELTETLMPKQANSYTELWLQSLAAPPERASLEPLSAGRVLQDGKYEVVKRLGVGGQGAAYMCYQHSNTVPATKSNVVLKETIIPVFVEAAIRKQALERFEQEARILKSFDSDCVVKLLDFFVEDHRGYLVLELIDGFSLRQLVEDKGPIGEEQATELLEQMCNVLGYLHQRGLIHRDFTPDNLILSKDGKLKLIDFNVAQHEDEGSTGVVVGKQAYLPPEQFRGKPTTQSDIYAMGATMYFLLTGKDPEPISQSSIQSVLPAVSDKLEQVVQKCTALDSTKRYGDINKVRQDLGITIQLPEESAAPADSVVNLAQTDEAIKEPVEVKV